MALLRLIVILAALLCWGAIGASAGPPVLLVSSAEHDTYMQRMPRLASADYDAILTADDLIFYTEETVPRAFQHSNHFFSAEKNLAALPDPFGHGNREFPWNVAMGTDSVENSHVVRFMRLPKRDDGSYWPIAYFIQPLPGELRDYNDARGRSSYQWVYPRGTVFGEVLSLEHDGQVYPYEMRLRIKDMRGWTVELFRPCPTADDLLAHIMHRRPRWRDSPTLSALVAHLKSDQQFQTQSFQDSAGTAFHVDVAVDTIPALGDDALAAEILTRTAWPSALGHTWRENTCGQQVFAPTTDDDGLHIVPRGYTAHMLLADSHNCQRCHEHTNTIVAEFEPKREWYGRIRGSDGILSFHPLTPQNASARTFVRTQWREELVQTNLLEQWNAVQHPADRYRRPRMFPLTREY